MGRSLAHVEKISAIEPIPNKDRIVLATVLGWKVIVQKDEFVVGDKCVYIEIDSVVPKDREIFAFLEKRDYRIKTLKMAGVISQGICFPMSILDKDYPVGADVTEQLGIKQYEPTQDNDREVNQEKPWLEKLPLMRYKWYRKLVCKTKRGVNGFPSFIQKTDETRIQNAPFYLNSTDRWVVTEKLDGQSGTYVLCRHRSKIPFMKDKFEYIVCSRSIRLGAPDSSSYWKVSEKYQIEECLKKLIGKEDWVCVQGECLGPGIQKNKYQLKDYDFYAFNLVYPNGRVGSVYAKEVCEKVGLKWVPIITDGYRLPGTVDEILQYAHGPSALGNTMREGIICRTRDGKRSFKAVDPQFLLKYNE